MKEIRRVSVVGENAADAGCRENDGVGLMSVDPILDGALARTRRREMRDPDRDGCDYISAVSTNLYDPGDNFDLTSRDVRPPLIRKVPEAKIRGAPNLIIWARERRASSSCTLTIALMRSSNCSSTISPPSKSMSAGAPTSPSPTRRPLVGFGGAIACDLSKPDGTPRKLMSGDKLRALGWPHASPDDGIRQTY